MKFDPVNYGVIIIDTWKDGQTELPCERWRFKASGRVALVEPCDFGRYVYVKLDDETIRIPMDELLKDAEKIE